MTAGEEAIQSEHLGNLTFWNVSEAKMVGLLHAGRRKCRNDQVQKAIKVPSAFPTRLTAFLSLTPAWQDMLDEYQGNITGAIAAYGYKGKIMDTFPDWSYPSAVVFAITTITLIGYGQVAPATDIGRFLLILYSVFGVPLTLVTLPPLSCSILMQPVSQMFLASIGKLFATFIRFVYGKGCCWACSRARTKHEGPS